MVITKQQILDKISQLKAYSIGKDPATGALFTPYEQAVNNYFSGTADIDRPLTDVIKYMYNDIWRRNTVYERNFPLSLPTDYPTGYNDITECFYQFSELLSISNETFYAGFVFESSGGEQPTQVPTSNKYLEKWTPEVQQAKASDKSNIEKLAEWCKNSEGNSDVISLLEDRGRIVSTLEMREIADIIYIDRKLLNIIKQLNLAVYIPSYYNNQ